MKLNTALPCNLPCKLQTHYVQYANTEEYNPALPCKLQTHYVQYANTEEYNPGESTPSYQLFNRESYVLPLLFPQNMFIWKDRQCVLVRFNMCQHLELCCYLAVLGHANMQWVGKTHKQTNVGRDILDRWLFTHVISWSVSSLPVLTKDCLKLSRFLCHCLWIEFFTTT